MLGFAMAVLVSDIGRPHRHTDGEERQERRDQVGARMRGLRDEAEAVRRQARAELEHDQGDGRTDRDERRAPLGVHAASETERAAEAARSVVHGLRYEVAMSPVNCSVTPFVPLSCQWWKISDVSGELYSKLNLQPA